jgi:large subunit ribosomal protein L30
MATIVVRQTRSLIGSSPKTKKVIASLGLGRIGKTKVHGDNNCIRGMINKVKHLVSFELSQKD